MTHGTKILKKATSTEDRNPIKLTLDDSYDFESLNILTMIGIKQGARDQNTGLPIQ